MNGPVWVQKQQRKKLQKDIHMSPVSAGHQDHSTCRFSGFPECEKTKDRLQNQAMKRQWRVVDKRESDKETENSVLCD